MDLVRQPLLLERARPSLSVAGRHTPRNRPQSRLPSLSGSSSYLHRSSPNRGKSLTHAQNQASSHNRPKARTRRISSEKQLGNTRRDLYSRLNRRTAERATPLKREVARSIQSTKQRRSAGAHPLVSGKPSLRTQLMKGV